MTEAQFEAVAELARLPAGPTREAARLVLVEGRRASEAAAATGCLAQSVSRTLKLCRRAVDLAKRATGIPAE